MQHLPASYSLLEQWFPTLTARAEALGLSRETLTSWERAQLDVVVRDSTARRITRLAEVARVAAGGLRQPSDVGRWMLAPQPALAGRTVADAVRDGEAEAVGRLLGPGQRAATPPPMPRPAAFEDLRRIPDSAPARSVRREQPRDREKAEPLARIGTPAEQIGPAK